MDKHVLALERSEKTTATLLSQLLKAQADNAALSAKLQEAEQLAPKLHEAEKARDLAMERCKRAINDLNLVREDLCELLSSCCSSTPPLPASTRTTKPLHDRSIVLKKAGFRIRMSKDDNKSGEGVSDPSAK
ncbi:hypothetical protein HYPSUDRAFT_210242 [Hypholoma sublateritium FD-334 SS-4]|uniref:Uncharacterized protein n=1 Tax=Hypholoma sublateritium (strain FD-334 SS-4) TaxID=945553 RepID=A0A0D2LPH7_HYPSF|nr:hypothetical protein HYPSUDRAFT_210242 [Hypholoma sublateritium FD-334 SS-4]